jgi:hypothetical protein
MLADLLSYLLFFSRFGIIIVFTASTIGKLRNISKFEQAIANFQIMPRKYIRIITYIVFLGEIATVSSLIMGGMFLSIGFLLAIFLLLVFSATLLSVLARGIQTPCNCFGPSQRPVSIHDVWRNISFIVYTLAGLVALLILGSSQIKLSLVDLGLLGLMAVVFVVLLAHLSDFVELFSTS